MYDPHRSPGQGKSMWQSSQEGMANVFGVIAALLLAPLLYSWTVEHFLRIAAKSYGPDWLAVLDLVWMAILYPAVFFPARMTFLIAISAAATGALLRFA